MSISFNQIPVTLRTPGVYVEFDNSKAIQGLVIDQSKTLIFGQKLAGGTASALQPVRVTGADQAIELFGRGSMLAEMVRAYRKANDFNDLWVLPLADNEAGVAAAGALAFTGSPTRADTLTLYVGGTRLTVAVAQGATTTTVASDVAAAINAASDLPVTATAATGTVTITARHKGTVYNGLDLRFGYYEGERLTPGLAVAITQLTGGAGNPDLAAALAALGDTQYHYTITPYTDGASLTSLTAEFLSRWSGLRQIEGQIFAGASGTHATLTTLGNGLNSEVLSIMGANASPTPAHIWASVYGAVAGHDLDLDPARPLQSLVLPGILPPKTPFIGTERNLLLYDGISTFTVGQDGTVRIERAITTYQVNSSGIADASYLDVETLATLGVLRRTARARFAQKFPRHKLANDGTNFGLGQAIVTPSILRAEYIALAREWEEAGWVENIDKFKEKLLVERDSSDANRVNAVLPPDIINQLRVLAAKIEFRL
jgi:phage tail sheath gpL-like